VVVLRSDSIQAYDVPIQAFEDGWENPVIVLDIEGDRELAAAAVERVRKDPPKVLVAFGVKAAWIAHTELPELPLVYAMVVSPERYGIQGEGVTGVRHFVEPDMQLAQLSLVAPDVQRLGMILSKDNDSVDSAEAIAAAARAGLDLRVLRVTTPRHVRKAWQRLRVEVDALWIVPDPYVVTPENFRYLRDQAVFAGMPTLASSEDLVRAGALMCVAPDREAVGKQVLKLTEALLAGTPIAELPIEDPAAVRVVLNVDTQEAIDLTIDEFTLDFVDEVIREAGRR
jgi:putative ABC transport system substrate-binding protein